MYKASLVASWTSSTEWWCESLSTVVNCWVGKVKIEEIFKIELNSVLTWCWVKNVCCWHWRCCWQSGHLDGWRWTVAVRYRSCSVRCWPTSWWVRGWSARTVTAATSGTYAAALGSIVRIICGGMFMFIYNGQHALGCSFRHLQSTENSHPAAHSLPVVPCTSWNPSWLRLKAIAASNIALPRCPPLAWELFPLAACRDHPDDAESASASVGSRNRLSARWALILK